MYLNKILLLALIVLISSCDNQVDDQTIVTPEQYKVVNPKAIERDFKSINDSHKVLVAIMDTGVDYNNEYLKNNIHFDLDQNANPISSGWDFTGNDPWPAPFVAHTNYFNPNVTDDERIKSQTLFEAHKDLLNQFPEFAEFFPLERNISEEDSEGIDHGTHVAGLASYDSPEIGILPYRVIPLNIAGNYDSFLGLLGGQNQTERFSSVLLQGLERAISEGAQVINMSLGMTFEDNDSESNKQMFEKFKSDLTQLVEAHPEVIFVVAAGNDGKWVDGTKVSILPCFIPKSNVICVSALTEDLNPATFSNIIKNEQMTTIFAWGHNILSTVPTNSCSWKEFDFLSITSKNADSMKEFVEKAKTFCSQKQVLKEMSGTSMASPIIARKVAKLKAQCPACNVKDIKEKLFSLSIASTHEGLPIWKLPVEKPSWYPKTKSFNDSYWSFYILKK
jgi:subtilisin family serine protease